MESAALPCARAGLGSAALAERKFLAFDCIENSEYHINISHAAIGLPGFESPLIHAPPRETRAILQRHWL